MTCKFTLPTGIVADKPTPNLNIYPRKQLEKVIRVFNMQLYKPYRSIGYMLNRDKIFDTSRRTHMTRKLSLDDSGAFLAEIEILDIDYGPELLDKMNKGYHITARPIMCVPSYINIIKEDECKDLPFIVYKINSIMRVLVECTHGNK